MISISFDLGNVPSVLAALRDPGNAQRVANAAAESYVDDIHDWIHSGRSFTPRNAGGLEQAIGWEPADNGSSVVYANKDYARFVEEGTKPHVIAPKPGGKGLKIPNGGVDSPVGPRLPGQGYVLRRKVNHPGSKAYPYFFIDMDARKQHMQERGLSVLASRMAQAGGGHG